MIYKAIAIYGRTAKFFFQEDYFFKASALSFISILSIVPFFSVIVYFTSYLHVFSEVIDYANQYIYNNFVPTSQDVIQKYLLQFVSQASSLPIFSILFSFLDSVLLILSIENTLNKIFHIQDRKRKMTEFIVIWLLLIFFPIVIGLLAIFNHYLDVLFSSYVQSFVMNVFNLILLGFIFSFFYIIEINTNITWKESFYGGFSAAILFEISRMIFSSYINHFAYYAFIYGALSTVPIFFVWVYVVWSIILFGAVLIYSKRALEGK